MSTSDGEASASTPPESVGISVPAGTSSASSPPGPSGIPPTGGIDMSR